MSRMTEAKQKTKKWYRPSNILFYALLLIAISSFIFPDVKALIISNLMKVGLFQPSISADTQQEEINLFSHTDLGFRNAQGVNESIDSLRDKVIILNFWATWCPPCRAEMPSMQAFYNRWQADSLVRLIMIDVDNKIGESSAYLKQKSYTMPNYISWTQYNNRIFSGSMPTTVVFDRSGTLVFSHTGAMDFDSKSFHSFITSLR